MKGQALHDLKNKIQLKEHISDNIYDDNKTWKLIIWIIPTQYKQFNRPSTVCIIGKCTWI